MVNLRRPQSLHSLRSSGVIIGAEMSADGLAVDDRPKRAAKVTHMITSAAPLDHQVVPR